MFSLTYFLSQPYVEHYYFFIFCLSKQKLKHRAPLAKLRCVRSTWNPKTLSVYIAANIEPVGFRAVGSAWSAEVNSPE